MTAKAKRIVELEGLIIHHKQLYYRGQADISDEAYDSLEDELRASDPDSYALQRVGFEVSDPEKKIRHTQPMLSLDKTRDPDAVTEWMAGEPCAVTVKLDGSSASLVYAGGHFQLAKSRGDGEMGENLTRHFQHIRFPTLLFQPIWRGRDVEIRGEVCIEQKQFKTLSAEMERRGLDRPKSIRNIVAGLLHRETELDLCTHLNFIAYEILADDLNLPGEKSQFLLLEEEGFGLPPRWHIDSGETFKEVLDEYVTQMEDYPYLSDGLVVAIEDRAVRQARGSTAHHPKGKLAFKFRSDSTETTVREVLLDVGRTGKLTFVALVDPVELSGACVQRVTLHNAKYVSDHQVGTGCRIQITRSGEVIPKHERTVAEGQPVELPSRCPRCRTTLERSESGVDLLCPNPLCPSRQLGRVSHWIAVCGIEHVGDETLAKLSAAGLVDSVSDLYRLRPEQVADLEGLAEKSAKNITSSIQGSLEMDLQTFLAALSIEGLGKGVARLLMQGLDGLDALRAADTEILEEIHGIGPILAHNILHGLAERGWPLLEELGKLGLRIKGPSTKEADRSLEGKTFVITGKLSRPRKELQTWIESRGGKVTGSVTSQTDFLICNESSSSSKYEKAVKLGIPILDETGLMDP
ncbi:MAG: NAD-dependent DNA ligase LigA [Deltaproteobacteria bacterium]|nr:NAD-dependent DNA ligase LigA [Deltaproteobacteria bacterium]